MVESEGQVCFVFSESRGMKSLLLSGCEAIISCSIHRSNDAACHVPLALDYFVSLFEPKRFRKLTWTALLGCR